AKWLHSITSVNQNPLSFYSLSSVSSLCSPCLCGSIFASPKSLVFLRQRRRDGQVEAVRSEVMVEQAELAVRLECLGHFSPLLLPDLPQILRFFLSADSILPQPLRETLRLAFCQQLLRVDVSGRLLLGPIFLRQGHAHRTLRLLLGVEALGG